MLLSFTLQIQDIKNLSFSLSSITKNIDDWKNIVKLRHTYGYDYLYGHSYGIQQLGKYKARECLLRSQNIDI